MRAPRTWAARASNRKSGGPCRGAVPFWNSRTVSLPAMSCEWWQQPDCLSVRYEDCVADPVGELNKLVAELGPPRLHSVEQSVEHCSLNALRKTSANNHYWQGRPGLWRELLPAAEA